MRDTSLEAPPSTISAPGPGPVRYGTLSERRSEPCRLGELAPETDVEQLVFELHAATLQANLERQLLGRPDAYDRAGRVIARLLPDEA
jgi:hypothetical protein